MRTVIPRSDGDGILSDSVVGAWMSPDVHVVHYPVRGGNEIAIVDVIAREPTTHRGWAASVDPADVFSRIAGFAPALQSVLMRAKHWRAWTLFEGSADACWSRGRVTLAR